MSNEIITLQFGNFSNYVGSHFWNIQEEILYQNTQKSPNSPELRTDNLIRFGESGGVKMFSPRCLIFDYPKNYGLLTSSSQKIFSQDPQKQLDLLKKFSQSNMGIWNSNVEIFHQPMESPPTLYSQLINKVQVNESFYQKKEKGEEKEEEGEKEDELPPVSEFTPLKIEKEEKNEQLKKPTKYVRYGDIMKDLDKNVSFWSDYLKSTIHEKSICKINYGENLGLYSHGVKLWSMNKKEEYSDRLRWFLEECNNFQGFLVFVDVNDVWGGLCNEFLSEIKDDLGNKTTIFTYGFAERHKKEDSERVFLNETLSVLKLNEFSDYYVPFSEYKSSPKNFPYCNSNLYSVFNQISPLHRSRLISNLSLNFNENCGNPYSQHAVVNGISKIPLYNQEKQTKSSEELLMDMFKKHVTKKKPFARKEREVEKNKYLVNCTTVNEMFKNFISQTKSYSSKTDSFNDPFYCPDSYPNYWNKFVTPNGFIDIYKEKETRVKSCPTLTYLNSSPEIKKYIDELNGSIKSILRKKITPEGMEMNFDEYKECYEKLLKISETYDE